MSALIHAATMVTAGVFLVARAHPFFEVSGDAMTVVAWIGAGTALLAGTVALVQPDIKRVLAYSTISQLGYMFLALGVGAYGAAIFLVITHAFFKATLFLGAGTVIHGNDDNQDMRIMGRLPQVHAVHRDRVHHRLPRDRRRAAVRRLLGQGRRAREGVPGSDYGLWIVGLLAAILTGAYMTRQVLLVFYGNERFRGHATPAEAAGTPSPPSPTHGRTPSRRLRDADGGLRRAAAHAHAAPRPARGQRPHGRSGRAARGPGGGRRGARPAVPAHRVPRRVARAGVRRRATTRSRRRRSSAGSRCRCWRSSWASSARARVACSTAAGSSGRPAIRSTSGSVASGGCSATPTTTTRASRARSTARCAASPAGWPGWSTAASSTAR